MNFESLNLRKVHVRGTSMEPVLHDGDTVICISKDEYSVGDILIFFYKNNEMLIHRLLKIENGRYFCKGDNAFRLEDVSKDQIIGAAKVADDFNDTSDFIKASLEINRVFRRSGYNIELTKEQPEFIRYKRQYFNTAQIG